MRYIYYLSAIVIIIGCLSVFARQKGATTDDANNCRRISTKLPIVWNRYTGESFDILFHDLERLVSRDCIGIYEVEFFEKVHTPEMNHSEAWHDSFYNRLQIHLPNTNDEQELLNFKPSLQHVIDKFGYFGTTLTFHNYGTIFLIPQENSDQFGGYRLVFRAWMNEELYPVRSLVLRDIIPNSYRRNRVPFFLEQSSTATSKREHNIKTVRVADKWLGGRCLNIYARLMDFSRTFIQSEDTTMGLVEMLRMHEISTRLVWNKLEEEYYNRGYKEEHASHNIFDCKNSDNFPLHEDWCCALPQWALEVVTDEYVRVIGKFSTPRTTVAHLKL